MPCCCAANCANRTENGVRLFPLPQGVRNLERRREWIRNIGRENLPKNVYVCQDHFNEAQFEQNRLDGKKLLRWNAVPTVFEHRKAARDSKVKQEIEDAEDVLTGNFIEEEVCPPSGFPQAKEVNKEVEEDAEGELELPLTVLIKEEPIEKDIEDPLATSSECPFVSVEQEEDASAPGAAAAPGLATTSALLTAAAEEQRLPSTASPKSTGRQQRNGEHGNECTECGKSFRYPCLLQNHARSHIKKCPFKCEECGRSFGQASYLHLHARIHTGERQFACEECGSSFRQSNHLQVHSRLHTGRCAYKCEKCGKLFAQVSSLKEHALTHTGERLYKCEKCGKAFRDAVNLQTHACDHTEVCPYKCMSGHMFNNPSGLLVNARIHTGERPYKCDVCGKCFRQVSHLNVHKSIHTEVREFKCEACGMIFRIGRSLEEHALIHIEDTPYMCKYCDQTFTDATTFYKHALIHMRTYKKYGVVFRKDRSQGKSTPSQTGDASYVCKHCDKTFVDASTLNEHALIHI